jgi:hypothetical protein
LCFPFFVVADVTRDFLSHHDISHSSSALSRRFDKLRVGLLLCLKQVGDNGRCDEKAE